MIDLLDYGFIPTMIEEDAEGIPARITAVHKERYELVCGHGETYGRLKSGIYYGNGTEIFPTTGDFALIQYNGSGDSLIIKTLEQRSRFVRNDLSGHKAEYVKTVRGQVIAANFDYVFIMASLNLDFNPRRIERYIALTWQSGAVPVIVLTKTDLVEDHKEQVQAAEKIASGIGVYAVSAKNGYGIDKLSDYLRPRKTIVFLGSSGVGKSSLVNALAGEEIMAVKEIREDDSRGRHATTHRQLIMLKSGVMIIDTPGMRELGMWNSDTGLGEAFTDVEDHLGRCRFSDCMHESEPGCAVKKAIAIGTLSKDRWDSYLKLKQETRFAEDKAAFLRDKNKKFKTIAEWSKQRNGDRR